MRVGFEKRIPRFRALQEDIAGEGGACAEYVFEKQFVNLISASPSPRGLSTSASSLRTPSSSYLYLYATL
jgi:hypothetical protein